LLPGQKNPDDGSILCIRTYLHTPCEWSKQPLDHVDEESDRMMKIAAFDAVDHNTEYFLNSAT